MLIGMTGHQVGSPRPFGGSQIAQLCERKSALHVVAARARSAYYVRFGADYPVTFRDRIPVTEVGRALPLASVGNDAGGALAVRGLWLLVGGDLPVQAHCGGSAPSHRPAVAPPDPGGEMGAQ
jgi:hypothetical protein